MVGVRRGGSGRHRNDWSGSYPGSNAARVDVRVTIAGSNPRVHRSNEREIEMTKFRTLILIGAIAGAARPVLANTEPPSAYDARSVGMGSTGVAHVENGASLYHNP